jgi:hypothetical protein
MKLVRLLACVGSQHPASLPLLKAEPMGRLCAVTDEDDPKRALDTIGTIPFDCFVDGEQDRCRDRQVAFAWRSPGQMPLCVVGVELGLLREQGAGGTVHLHRDLVERAGRRVMRKANPHNVL